MNYQDYQQKVSSEKLVLAIMEPSKQLIAWTLHSGSVYKITDFKYPIITSITDSGNSYTEVGSLGAVTASTYFLDRDAQTLYIRTTGSDNPNGRFIVAIVKLFFANNPIALPYDLDSGLEVFFEPLISTSSEFGVEIDTINQTSEAIEGSGSLTMINDQDFFPKNFDKISFENASCSIWSYHRKLAPTEAKKIFEGKIDVKRYSPTNIQFNLKDLLTQLRTSLNLGTVADLGARTSSDVNTAKLRMILGRVTGHVGVNLDQVLNGYPVTGTVSVSFGSDVVNGSGTLFLREMSPDDRLTINGDEYTVATVVSDTQLTLSDAFSSGSSIAGASITIIPEKPKRWQNRIWNLAGHTLKQTVTQSLSQTTIRRLFVDSVKDFLVGDWIYIGPLGSGEQAQVENIIGSHILLLRNSLETIPQTGTDVTRICVQNVRIDDTLLVYERDFTVDPDTATLTLEETAEANASQIRYLNSNLSFMTGSRIVTGTNLKATLQVGWLVGVIGNAVFREILSIDSDTQLTLRTASNFTTNDVGRYKTLLFNPESSKLSMDVFGRTVDGTSNGEFPKSGPGIVKMLLDDLGLTPMVHTQSFLDSEDMAGHHLGVVFPAKFDSSDDVIYRDMINTINKSMFGYLIQDNDFKFRYNVLFPDKALTARFITSADCLSFAFDSSSEKLIKTSIVQYSPREFDYLTGKESIRTQQKTSDVANYVKRATESRTFVTKLADEKDAEIIANRWSFILENGSGRCKITTKLQTMDINVGDVIYLSHPKLFERIGTSMKARLFLVEAAKKNGLLVNLELVDLSNAFARVAGINDLTVDFGTATDEQKLFGGFITDVFGLINNDPDSFGVNLIW